MHSVSSFQADFLTAANKDILANLPWNKTLRNGMVDAFSQSRQKNSNNNIHPSDYCLTTTTAFCPP